MMAYTLSVIPIFSSLSSDEMRHVESSLRKLSLAKGQILFREGDPGGRLYIVADGRLDIVKAFGTPEEQLLRIQEPGGYVGEMSLFDPKGLRSATVRARTDAELLEMDHERFVTLLQRKPRIAYEVARLLSIHLHRREKATIRTLQKKNRELAQAYEELQAAQVEIIKKERLEHELQLAREIQLSMLPSVLPTVDGFSFEASMIPAKVVCGDFYDFIPLDHNHLGIAVGDVCGKGAPAAIFMAMTRSLMRSQAVSSMGPRQVLAGVNRHLMEMNSAGMFVTVLYGVLDRRNAKFTYARAGHCLPIVLQPGRNVCTPSHRTGQALGVFDDPELDEQAIDLSPGDLLVLYTDGVVDAEDEEGEPLGLERLTRVLLSADASSAQQCCEAVVRAIEAHQGEASQSDDITLVVTQAAER